jgi:hypothetical protein
MLIKQKLASRIDPMRRVLMTLGWLLTLLIVALFTLGGLMMFDSEPLVEQDLALTAAERGWAKKWLANTPPRRKRPGELVTLTLSERQATLIANELVNHFGTGRARVQLHDQRAQIAVSLALPWDPAESFINLRFELVANGTLPQVENAQIAGLPLPDLLVQTLAERALAAVESTQAIQQMSLQQDHLEVRYYWRPDLLERIGSSFIANADLPLLLHYQKKLSELLMPLRRGRSVKLADVLAHLLIAAAEQPLGTDPVAENRAVILVLAAYVNGHPIRDPADTTVKRLPYAHPVLLRERQDLGQHFMTSAALLTQGGDTLSGLVGWYKELSDSNGGSGFSFADMAANRAGIRLAQRATANPASASTIQQRAAAGLSEDDFMPTLDGLPEGMDQKTFSASFGNQNNADYQRMMAVIDRRIDAARLFRTEPQ